MTDRRLTLLLTFLWFPFAAYCQITDISGYFDPSYDRKISCAQNVSLLFNDNARSVVVLCSGAPFDAPSLRECTDYWQFKSMVFFNCLLPSPDMSQVLENFRPEILMVSSNVTWNYDEVIVRNLPNMICLVLHIKGNITFRLENLDSLSAAHFLFSYAETLPEDLFSNLTTLNIIHLQYGETRYLPQNIFRGLRRLSSLFLSYNKLEELPESIFHGLHALQLLDLLENRLSFLPPKIFNGLISLQKLSLACNQLMQLPSQLFKDNVYLEIVVISNNSISSLPADFLRYSPNLFGFKACLCNISQLAEDTFFFSPLLEEIYLCQNRLRALPPNSFSENRRLQFLNLSDNLLHSLPSDVFASNRLLWSVDLSMNRLDSIGDAFRNAKLLENLFLSRNKISEIEEHAYANLENIRYLNLKDNQIRSIPGQAPFGRTSKLSRLDLSRNRLTAFQSLEWSAYNISFLDLSANDITSLDVQELPPSPQTVVSLRDNEIASVVAPVDYVFSESVRLHGNPFECNCSLRNFVDAVRSAGVKSLFCSGPREFENQSLAEIGPSHFLCPRQEDCPRRCRCYLAKDSSVIVNCSSSRLTRLPSILPPNTSTVYLQHNLLSDVTSENGWSSVRYLNLDYNSLDPSKFWHLPASLEFLSVRHNNLEKLSKEFLKQIDDKPRLKQLDIGGNRFWCNCSFTYFKVWFDHNLDRIAWADEVMCSRLFLNNNTLVNSSLARVPLDAFCPPDPPAHNLPLLVAGSVVSFIAVALLVCIVLFLKYKTTVLAYLYVHFPLIFGRDVSAMDSDKRYDAFVSYTGSDREVAMTLLRELEEKPPYFKLCIHERNWMPGNAIVSQIEDSIRHSRKTVIVLSKEFLDSVWCETEFQVAYLQCLEDKVDRLIMIVKGTLPVRDLMPVDMQNLLATKTFLVWGERWFWEKLRYSMPHYSPKKSSQHQLTVVDGMIQDLRNQRLI